MVAPSDDYKKKVIKRYDGFSKYYDSLDTGLVKTTVERRKKAVERSCLFKLKTRLIIR